MAETVKRGYGVNPTSADHTFSGSVSATEFYGSGANLIDLPTTPIIMSWTFSSTTTSGDPGSGKMRFNNSDYSNVNELYFNNINGSGLNIANSFVKLTSGDDIYIKQADSVNLAVHFQVSGVVIDNSGWHTIPVAFVDQGDTPIGNNKTVAVGFETYRATNLGEVNTASNIGSANEVFKQKTGVDLEFRTFDSLGPVDIITSGDKLVVSASDHTLDTGEVNTASNVGGETGIFKQKSGVDLEFYTLSAGQNINLIQNGDVIGISANDNDSWPSVSADYFTSTETDTLLSNKLDVSAESWPTVSADYYLSSETDALLNNKLDTSAYSPGEVNTASNVGGETGIFKQKNGVDLEFYTLSAGPNIALIQNGDVIGLSGVDPVAGSGETNTASNTGNGEGIFAQKTGVDLQFKSILGENLLVSADGDEILLSAAPGAGEANTASNVGGGENVFKQKSGVDLEFRTLKSIGPVDIITSGDNLVVSAAAAAAGSSTYKSNKLYFKYYSTNSQLPNFGDSNPQMNDMYGNPSWANGGFQTDLSTVEGIFIPPVDITKVNIHLSARLANINGGNPAPAGTTVTFTVHFVETEATTKSVLTTADIDLTTTTSLNQNAAQQANDPSSNQVTVDLGTTIPAGAIIGTSVTCSTNWGVVGNFLLSIDYVE
jgi:hypothetical protein